MDPDIILALALSTFAIVVSILSGYVDLRGFHIVEKKMSDIESRWTNMGTFSSQLDTYLNTPVDKEGTRNLDNIADAFSDSIGNWLLAPSEDKPDAPFNIDLLSGRMGQYIARSFSNAAKGITSGDVREYRMVEKKLLEGIQDPQVTKLLEFADRIGVPRELAGVLLNAIAKNGLMDKLGSMGNNGASGSVAKI